MAWIYKEGAYTYFTYMGTEQTNNATEFYNYFINKGVSLEAICGMLGNVTRESTLNPAITGTGGGGLIGWTPVSVIKNWCKTYGYNWYDGAAQCERIWCEGTNTKGAGGTWLPTPQYSYTWNEFIKLNDVAEACKAYLYERERAGVEALSERLTYASGWYDFFKGTPVPPSPPTPPTPFKRNSMPIYMMLRKL